MARKHKRNCRCGTCWKALSRREGVGLIGDVAMGATALTGLVTNADQPPNTDQLNDSLTSQTDRRRTESVNDATTDRGRNASGSSGSSGGRRAAPRRN